MHFRNARRRPPPTGPTNQRPTTRLNGPRAARPSEARPTPQHRKAPDALLRYFAHTRKRSRPPRRTNHTLTPEPTRRQTTSNHAPEQGTPVPGPTGTHSARRAPRSPRTDCPNRGTTNKDERETKRTPESETKHPSKLPRGRRPSYSQGTRGARMAPRRVKARPREGLRESIALLEGLESAMRATKTKPRNPQASAKGWGEGRSASSISPSRARRARMLSCASR